MKFSRQLEYFAYPPWNEHYIAYKQLKRVIKGTHTSSKHIDEAWTTFEEDLNRDTERVVDFFSITYEEVVSSCNSLIETLRHSTEQMRHGSLLRRVRGDSLHSFLELGELVNFIHLNSEGVRKLIKKFDKTHSTNYTLHQMQSVSLMHDLERTITTIEGLQVALVTEYARLFTEGNIARATEELSSDLSELINWDRRTVWNDLHALERNRKRLGITRTSVLAAPEKPTRKTFSFIFVTHFVIFLMFAIICFYPISTDPSSSSKSFEQFRKQRCLGVLFLASSLWALGSLPLFVTALLLPIMVVVLNILPMNRPEAADLVMLHFWGEAQSMVLGSFAIAAGLSKLGIDKNIAYTCLSGFRVRMNGSGVLLRVMVVSWLASAFLGNVAASVLAISIAGPILNDLPAFKSSTLKFGNTLLLGIAIACNLGGMSTPVASPHNVVAFSFFKSLGLSFQTWSIVGLIVSGVCLLVSYSVLKVRLHGMDKTTDEVEGPAAPLLSTSGVTSDTLDIKIQKQKNMVWGWSEVFVVSVSFLTVGLWMSREFTKNVFGDVGIASLLPLVFLFSGVLSKSDLLSLPWDVCLLLSGGSILGLTIKESGLLSSVIDLAETKLTGVSVFACTLLMCVLVTILSSFVSHTAAANILMPFVVELSVAAIGQTKAALIALPVSLCLSAGMMLPISSFPNMNSISLSMHANDGDTWVHPRDFLIPGFVMSVVTCLVSALIVPTLLTHFLL